MQSHITTICHLIRNWVETGQEYSADVKEYAESILGVCEFDELTELLVDTDNPDAEPFLEYLLFPDTTLMSALETQLIAPFSPEDASALRSMLCSKEVALPLHGESESFPVVIPEWLWDSFLTRLHLTDTTFLTLSQKAPQLASDLALKTRVCLRTARLPKTTTTIQNLSTFFTAFPDRDPLFYDLLHLWISVLTTRKEDASKKHGTLKKQLETNRRRLYKAIFEAQEFAQRLLRYNMETLMMTGVQPPSINVEDARFQLRLIDRLSTGIFASNVASLEELEDRGWGDYLDNRASLPLLPE